MSQRRIEGASLDRLGKGPTKLITPLSEISRAARKVLGRPVSLTPETDIVRDLDVDSLALMNIVMELEDAFDLSIPLDHLQSVQTVSDLISVVDGARGEIKA